MPIESYKGDIWRANTEAVVIPVNCVGVMGAGLAKQCRDRYPLAHAAYMDLYRQGLLSIGRTHYANGGEFDMVFFPTKHHWRDRSNLQDIIAGLCDLRMRLLNEWTVKALAIPALGCGLGGLRWADVRPLITEYMEDLPTRIIICEPNNV